MATTAEALALALQYHQAGNVQQAEQLYRQILQAEPAHADALHLLGVLAHQLGRQDLAVSYIGRALALRPQDPSYHSNLGAAYQALGRRREAEACFRATLRLWPDHPEAHFNLGKALKDQGRLGEAEACFREALRLRPDYPEAHNTLGNALHAQGRLPEAVACYAQALRLRPDYPEARYNLGNALKDGGRLGEAAACYREALRLRPGFVQALGNLGDVLLRLGRPDEAEACYREALRLRPGDPEAHYHLGNALRQQGRLDPAVACYRQALALRPDFPEAFNDLGNALREQGRLEEAVTCFRQALRLQSALAEAHNNLGNVLQAQGRAGEAEACFREALRLQPDFAAAHNNLGNALQVQGRWEEAEACLRQAVRLHPGYAEAYNNLGVVLQKPGQLKEAEACFREALRLQPSYAGAHSNLGNALQAQGRSEEAEACLREAVRLHPGCAEAYNNLGVVLQKPGRLKEAEACFREALRLQPNYAEVHANLGNALKYQGDLPGAEAHLQEALRLQPSDRLRLALATLLPPVYQSADDLLFWRQRLTEKIGLLLQEGVRVDLTDELAEPPFLLAYQGYNERDTQRQLACLHAPPPDSTPAPGGRRNGANRKLKVGFLSAHFRNHTIGRLMQGFIARLARDAFEVTVLSVGRYRDEIAQFIRRHADRYVEVPTQLSAARQAIAREGLDVLCYPDIGLEPVSCSLAFSRLAPVQCTTWAGHPLTTGIETIDYYLSSDLMEPADAEQHYTEALVRMKSLPTYYYRPVLPPLPRGREHFGLREGEHAYACPQSLFKFHPAFDEILAGVLRADPAGVLVLVRGLYPQWEEILLRRWAATMPDVLERVRWLPRLDYPDFLSLSAAADVLLDPHPFGGGNTSLEGLALGTPIVTLPSPFLRGRFTLGVYRKMAFLDCVASSPQQYVEFAVRLGTDPDFRAAVRSKILAASGVLYEDQEAVEELERFLLWAVDRAGRNPAGCPG